MVISVRKVAKVVRKMGGNISSFYKEENSRWTIAFNGVHYIHVFRDMNNRAVVAFNTVIDDKNFTMRCVTRKINVLKRQLMDELAVR